MEYGVDERLSIGSDGTADILLYWFTVSLMAGNDAADKAAILNGALRDCKVIDTSAHVLSIMILELASRLRVQDFTL